MRILHSIATVDPASGGPAEGVRQIGLQNLHYGHRVEVVSLDDPASPWVAKYPFPVHAVGPSAFKYAYSPRLVPWLRENARRFDCVIVNGIWNYNCLGTRIGLMGTGVPYFVYTHGMLDPWFKYRYPHKHLKKWLYWPWALYPLLRDASAVMFTCEEERRLARESFWLYDCNEIVVGYGTSGIPEPTRDYSANFLERHPDLRGKRCLVFLGRVHPKKGPDLLVRAVAALQAQGLWDAARMRVVLAGPADGDYAQELKRLAARLGIADGVYWTGLLLGDDKWGALQCAEAFVLPSHQENFGIAVAEALSAGVPVLLSRAVNIWQTVCAEGAGFADDDTAAGCARLLRRWFEGDMAQRARMALRARACFKRNFTSRVAASSLLSAVYLQLISEKRRAKAVAEDVRHVEGLVLG